METIPKIIHYCWFGPKKMTSLQVKCIRSWELNLKDYKIIRWDESNIEMSHPFILKAYNDKKWAFVADYVRLQKVKELGGIYLDTDMLVLKSLDIFLLNKGFFGAEDEEFINASIFGCIPDHPFLDICLKKYDDLISEDEINWFSITIPRIITESFRTEYDFSSNFDSIIEIEKLRIFPPSYFYPLPYLQKDQKRNYKSFLSESSYAVHLWDESWIEYSEFENFRKGRYSEGFKKFLNEIVKNKKLEWSYVKKNLSAIKDSLNRKV